MKLNFFKILICLLSTGIWFISNGYSEDKLNEPFQYKENGKRDPFWPLVTGGGAIVSYESDLLVSDLTLEGIMSGANNQYIAMINGKIVRLNDKVGQFVIKQIDVNSVVVSQGEQIFRLKLKKEE